MNLSVFDGKKILVTGASGLIGKEIVASLIKNSSSVQVYALVRNEQKARKVFENLPQSRINYVVCDICNLKAENLGINYIIHGASKTASKDFINEPVEVILNSVEGTRNILEFARQNPVEGLVYLSTMEVYGTPQTDELIYENNPTNLDTMEVRASYPESKRLCENLCASYCAEYGVKAKVVRLTQTFGKGVEYDDGRVFAEFARCAIEGRNIILKTKGETRRCYIGVQDAVDAIFTVLVNGADGEAYNVANGSTYCSVYDMAATVAKHFGNGRVKVLIEEGDAQKMGYAKTLRMNLSTQKLQNLGWEPKASLVDIYKEMIEDMKQRR